MTGADRALVDRFLEMMAAEAGASRHTLAAYRNDLARTSDDLADGLAASDSKALEGLAGKWRDLAPATVARRSAALRRFYAFLVEEGARRDDPSAALPRPTLRRPLPRILELSEMERIFEAVEARAASGRGLLAAM